MVENIKETTKPKEINHGDDQQNHVVEKVVEVPVEKIVERIVEVPVEKIVEVPVEKIVERIVEVPVEKIVERIVEVPVEKVVERIVEVPVEVERPASKDLSEAARLLAQSEFNKEDLTEKEILDLLNKTSEEEVKRRMGFWAMPLPQSDSDNTLPNKKYTRKPR